MLLDIHNEEQIKKVHKCICCGTQLLHHLNRDKSYWFCPNCLQEMFSSF